MKYGAIERTVYIDASPEVVYEVVSSPKHIVEWFVDDAEYDAVAGADGRLGFGDATSLTALPMTVVDAIPGVRFSFRWMAPPVSDRPPIGAKLTSQNSVLVAFDISASGTGTSLRVTESGMRELGWEAAMLEQYYNEHSEGWVVFLAKLRGYAAELPETV